MDRIFNKIVLAFFVAQLINVVLSTLKSVITIKGGKNWAAVANAIAYGFNTIVIKSIIGVDVEIAVAITIITNLIGVYFGLGIIEKLRKDQLWKITVSINLEDYDSFEEKLKDKNISFIKYETGSEKHKVADVFSNGRQESKIIKDIFKEFKVKYTISANSGTL